MSSLYAEAVAKFGANKLTDKNGKPLAGPMLENRIRALEGAEKPTGEVLPIEGAPTDGEHVPAEPKSLMAKAFAAKRSFVIEDDIPLPPIKRGTREGVYPFKALRIGQRFVVKPTEDMPHPHKNMGSVASRASRSLWPKKFESRELDASDPQAPGCGVWRVMDATEPVKPRKSKTA